MVYGWGVDGVRYLREVSSSALRLAFEMLFAKAYVDSFAEPLEKLNRRIETVEEAMAKMIDYIHREFPTNVYDGINRIYEKSAKEADIRKRYIKLSLAYLLALLYLSVRLKTLTEEAEEYLKTHNKA
jgi:ribosome biogenesis protein Nip4